MAPATRRLIRMGVDSIASDRPDVLRKVMAEEGLPLPASNALSDQIDTTAFASQ